MMKMHLRHGLLAAVLAGAVFGGGPSALGQRAESARAIYEEQLRVELDRQQTSAREMGLDVGGWFSFALFNYDDESARRHRMLRQYDLRLWSSYTIRGVHRFYARGRFTYDDWNRGDHPDNNGDEFGCELERLFYTFDTNRLVRNRTGGDPKVGLELTVGREYHEIGTGLTLALTLDAVRAKVNVGNVLFTGLIGKTVTNTHNIDDAYNVADHMDRCFYGGEVRYTGLGEHQPFIYYLAQRDHTDAQPNDPFQKFHYDSEYLGAGSAGSVLVPNLRYSLEFVFQSGRSYADGSTDGRERIHAFGADLLLEYLFDKTPCHPKVTFEYLWGSGDPDRSLSATSTVGGNVIGTDDTAFNAFGFRDTGLAFAPRMANLHIWQIGVSAFPLEKHRLFEKMEVGTKAYFYAKDRRDGAISDTGGTRHQRWVGWEWDVYCNWRILSDLAWTIRYGFFQPGDAFSRDDCRQFLYSGLTYSF